METALPIYSAAQDLRTGGADAVRAALLAARKRTLLLADAYAEVLRPAAMRVPYGATINPPLWEWGHVAWFQEWWIARNRQRSLGTRCDPDHERSPSLMRNSDQLFDSGRIEHTARWSLPLPDEKGTRAWMAATLDSTLDALEGMPASAGDDELYFFKLVALHEEMHSEAAAYMARGLGVEVPAQALRAPDARRHVEQVLQVPAQEFTAGWQGGGFAFDNELQSHPVRLGAFEIDAQPVSAARFAQFAGEGGYRDRLWWDDAGWTWLAEAGPTARGIRGEGEGAAVHVNAHEAEAWCRWAGRRLPTEFEWECAALTQAAFRWGEVWEWTASAFTPYAGFAPHPYRDYSAPWFGTRRTLRGACAATSARLAHPRYRNFFEPHRRDILSGFRSCA